MSKERIAIQNIREPSAIEATSLSIIDSEVPEPRPFAGYEWEIVRRMIHTTADFELLSLVRFHEQALSRGLASLKSGKMIVTDTEMARMGIPLRRMTPLGVDVICFMNDGGVISAAKSTKSTRAAMAMEKALELPKPPVLVVGNAPTALLTLMDCVDGGAPVPPLVVAMPVGFVNAAESKELLVNRGDIPYITVTGRKGGSAMAACVINAMAEIILREKA